VAGAGAIVRLGKTAERGLAVIGHSTDNYVGIAQQLGAKYFYFGDAWNALSEAERFALNQKFLDDVIAAGDDVMLATRRDLARAGSVTEWEINYLLSAGYRPTQDGYMLLAP
jgi:hypothetical protein